MSLLLIQGDITKLECDAIVNAANNSLLGGGGVDGAIHRAAGPKLLEECRALRGCDTGDAKLTAGYELKAKFVIHTVGPVWHGGAHGEEKLLRSCYSRSLKLAYDHNCESVAFPMISAGVYGYPFDQALEVAVSSISAFLNECDRDMTVYIVIFSRRDFRMDKNFFGSVRDFIDSRSAPKRFQGSFGFTRNAGAAPMASSAMLRCEAISDDACEDSSIEEFIRTRIDESFTQMLLRLIDEKGMSDVETYKRANIDRKLFSKIRSNMNYHPKKNTVLGFAIALRLDINETADLLMKAGYALSDSSRSDLVVEYFITNEIYDVNKVNQVLFAMDQEIIGQY
ncbi:MAG: O-acetyl-ADP-ribose deacetylase [Clostridiales bacterium]|nr:O-acetyl-ADP-ribose deacetylase [Clostridiales bacterium]